jgi:plasmid stabilization system protein ParE
METLRTSSFWRDLKGILDYFGELRAEDSALRFLDALDETISFIGDFPDLGSPWESPKPRPAGLRFRLVKEFENYLVLYRRDDQLIYVLRVVHGSQDIEQLLG